jgi:hypothetical protein
VAPAAGTSAGQAFEVPAGCAAQWIAVRTGSRLDQNGEEAWIDQIDIRRL